jgi:hypothetical protein
MGLRRVPGRFGDFGARTARDRLPQTGPLGNGVEGAGGGQALEAEWLPPSAVLGEDHV